MAEETDKRTPEEKETHSRLWKRTGLEDKTLWDLLQLLIVPLALAAIGFFFTLQQDARQQAIEDQRAKSERKIEEQRAQDAALQAYLDAMSSLLLAKDGLRNSEVGSEVRTLARARTITVLGRLDPSRKTAVMQFLVETELVQRVEERAPLIELTSADLSGVVLRGSANLQDAELTSANLQDAELTFANLQDAELLGANLSGADLQDANLQGANLTGTDLHSARLFNTTLSFATLGFARLDDADLQLADLNGADLRFANLRDASLRDADLQDADLSSANLNGAFGVTKERLKQEAESLEGATMPDGSKHP
jgi:uncharacterized protein YjbI with pentapeptide repeats